MSVLAIVCLVIGVTFYSLVGVIVARAAYGHIYWEQRSDAFVQHASAHGTASWYGFWWGLLWPLALVGLGAYRVGCRLWAAEPVVVGAERAKREADHQQVVKKAVAEFERRDAHALSEGHVDPVEGPDESY